jgi:hypothetical protein
MDYPQLQLGMPVRELKYRFQWNAPIVVSPHDPDVLYHASQYVHRSTNEGQSWEVISPDLTRNDTTKMGFAGEPITRDITGVEVYGSILALAESPVEPGVLWAGSNDGLVHVSRDNGRTWRNVTPRDLPAHSTVNRIEVSRVPGRALIAVYRYLLDDWKPYIFKTEDYGQSWTLLTTGNNGIPANYPTRVVREDPDRRGLLYAGTEFGIFISFDDGANWQPFQLNLPVTPITDLVVHQKDLVVATQGRSFWILDDLTPLHQLTPEVVAARAHLFKPRPAYRTQGTQARPSQLYLRDPIGGARIDRHQMGQNPPAGAVIFYSFAEAPTEEVRLEVLDSEDRVIRAFTSAAREGERTRERLSKRAGLNRFVWDLSYPGARLVEGVEITGSADGPRAVPGTYKVRLTVGSFSATESFEVLKDPRVPVTVADLRAQFDLQIQIRDRINQAQDAVRVIRSVTRQLDDLAERVEAQDQGGDIKAAAQQIARKLLAIEDQLIQRKGAGLVHQPMLTEQLAWLNSIVASADAKPTEQSYTRFRDLDNELTSHLETLRGLLEADVVQFNRMVQERGVPPVVVPSVARSVAAPDGTER